MNACNGCEIRTRLRAAVLFAVVALLFVAYAPATARADQSWEEYANAPDGFAISAPSAPANLSKMIQTKVGPVEARIWQWDMTTVALFVSVSDYPSTSSNVQETLTNVASGEAGSWKGGHVVSSTPITLQGVAGLDCVIVGDDFHSRSRIFFRGRRLWQVLSIGATGGPLYDQTDRFFASFRFVGMAY
jgi:hypothetical protein